MKILSMSGFIPEEICDTVRFTGFEGRRAVPHFCGYAADFISQVQEDASIDGAVFPRSCDSCRAIEGYLNETHKFVYRFIMPARRDGLAKAYLAREVQRYKKAVEDHYHVRLDDICRRHDFVLERNRKIRALYDNISDISYAAYLAFIHDILKKPLFEQTVPENLPGKPAPGKRVYLVGSFLSNLSIAGLVEASGLSIVGDNLTQSKRLFSTETKGENIYEAIAGRLLSRQLSPTEGSFETLIENDLTEIEKKNARGVIFLTQKYCEAYDYLYNVYKKALDARNIPLVRIAVGSSTDAGSSALQIESFRDML